MIKLDPFDLVLTDGNVPVKSGLKVVRETRARNADAPILMITTEAEKRRVIEAGISDYLIKPFTADTLREKLEKARLRLVTAQTRC